MFVLGSIKLRPIALHLIAVLAVAVVLPLALYWRVNATAQALHERALREQAQQIAAYLHRLPDGNWALDLPNSVRELYSAGYARYGFAILTQSGKCCSRRAITMNLCSDQIRDETDRPTSNETLGRHATSAPAYQHM